MIEKDRFVPQTTVPGLSDDTYFTVHPANTNPALEGMVGGRRDNERGLGAGGDGGGIQNVGDLRQFSGTTALFS